MTRPEAQNQRFLALLRQEVSQKVLPGDLWGRLDVVESPLMQIRPHRRALDLSGYEAVIFTSRAGLEDASGATDTRLRAFCVGTATAQYAQSLGWAAEACGGDADHLVPHVAAAAPKSVLHLRGEHSRGAVAERLSGLGVTCGETVIYAQDLLALTARAEEALDGARPLIVPLFSPRAARYFAGLAGDAEDLTLIAISEATAEPLRNLQCKALHVSNAATAQSMVQDLLRVIGRDLAGA